MATQEDLVTDTKCIITSLLISSTLKFTVKQLCNDFTNNVGYCIPYKRMGFTSAEQYLHSIPDTITIIGSGPNAEVIPVVKPKSAHINQLVSKQKKPSSVPSSRRKSYTRPFNQPSTSFNRYGYGYQPRNHYSPNNMNGSFNQYQYRPQKPKYTPPVSQDVQHNSSDNVYVGPDLDDGPSTPEEDDLNEQILKAKMVPLTFKEEEYKSRVPRDVQNNLRKLIAQFPEGVWCTKLPEEYRKAYHKGLNFSKYEYRSLIEMCTDLPEIFHCVQGSSDDYIVCDRNKPLPDVDKNWLVYEPSPESEPVKGDILAEIGKLDWAVGPLLIPPDVMHLTDKIPRHPIVEEGVGDYLDICIGEIYDPSKFWVYLRLGPLNKLMDDLQHFFKVQRNKFVIPRLLLTEGLYCSALFFEEYHRAVIVNLLPDVPNKIRVLFIDYGTVGNVNEDEVWYLPKQFGKLPYQAIRARLSNIYPPVESSPWSLECTARFRELVMGINMAAEITRIDLEDKVLEIYLADISNEKDIFYINDVLVKEEYAIYTDQVILDN